jgi:hypothetical protein
MLTGRSPDTSDSSNIPEAVIQRRMIVSIVSHSRSNSLHSLRNVRKTRIKRFRHDGSAHASLLSGRRDRAFASNRQNRYRLTNACDGHGPTFDASCHVIHANPVDKTQVTSCLSRKVNETTIWVSHCQFTHSIVCRVLITVATVKSGIFDIMSILGCRGMAFDTRTRDVDVERLE